MGEHRRFCASLAIVLGLLSVYALSARAEAGDGFCRDVVGRDFSSASPVDVGLSPERLLALNDALEKEKYEIRSLLIQRDCKLVFERYKEGVSRNDNHSLYSVTKSFSATLVGELLYQGKLASVDKPIADLVPKPWWFSQENWEKARRITLKNVMQMSSGLAYKHDPVNTPIYALTADRFSVALSPDLAAEPGTKFNYSDGDVSITGAVIAAVADKDLYRFAREALFDPLQMYNYDWWFKDDAGRYPGGWGLHLRPMDMVKLGQLYIQRGEWNGRRYFAADFPDIAWAHGPSKLYALHWWIGSAAEAGDIPYFVADGFKGQKIYVFPTLHLVAAVTASMPNPEVQAVNALIVGALVGAAQEGSAQTTNEVMAAIKDRQARGFNGDLRVFQEDQDRPRRP
jgi:CubicO group peptidase (beta-lactamase class C family)